LFKESFLKTASRIFSNIWEKISTSRKRSPAALLAKSRTQQKSFVFLLEEKIGRAQIKKCRENFFAGWRGFRATAGRSVKVRSPDFRQKKFGF